MSYNIVWYLLVLLGYTWGRPHTYHDGESRPLVVVSELSQRLASASHSSSSVPESRGLESRLPLPSPQELEAIKKVAQILIMLGEQVIPTIIGESGSGGSGAGGGGTSATSHGHNVVSAIGCDQPSTVEDIPNDPIKDR